MQKNHLKEILFGLFVTIVGGIVVVQYEDGLHKPKENETELTPPTDSPEIDNSKSNILPFEKSENKPTISQSVSQNDKKDNRKESIEEKDNPIESSTKPEDKGLSIRVIDKITHKPVEGVSVSFSGFPDVLTTNKNGDFFIPKIIIDKRGEYNSVRTYFTRNGFEAVDYEIGLSEPQTFKINKLQ